MINRLQFKQMCFKNLESNKQYMSCLFMLGCFKVLMVANDFVSGDV